MILLTQQPLMTCDDDYPIPYRIASTTNTNITTTTTITTTITTASPQRRKSSLPSSKSSIRASPPRSKPSRENSIIQLPLPKLSSAPWDLTRRKTRSLLRRSHSTQELRPASSASSRASNSSSFRKLPREVYECIVQQLEDSYFGNGDGGGGEDGSSCAQCYARDLYHLSLTSRAWDRAVNLRMYRHITIPAYTSSSTPPIIPGTSALTLLRRTLRERPTLARTVRTLHMPSIQALHVNASISRSAIVDLVAALVMACPNLERLTGFHVPYTHAHDRLSHALATRPCLRERVWVFGSPNDDDDDDDDDGGSDAGEGGRMASRYGTDDADDPSRDFYHAATDPTERFLELNAAHVSLTSLVLHHPAASRRTPHGLNFRAIIGTLRQLPQLRDLCLSGLPRSAFSNVALTALPPTLRSLRLENLRGVTETGLRRFAETRGVRALESIVLVDLEIADADILGLFLQPRMARLRKFVLVQGAVPMVTTTGGKMARVHSVSLEELHWEVRGPLVLPPAPPTGRGRREDLYVSEASWFYGLAGGRKTEPFPTGVFHCADEFPSLRRICIVAPTAPFQIEEEEEVPARKLRRVAGGLDAYGGPSILSGPEDDESDPDYEDHERYGGYRNASPSSHEPRYDLHENYTSNYDTSSRYHELNARYNSIVRHPTTSSSSPSPSNKTPLSTAQDLLPGYDYEPTRLSCVRELSEEEEEEEYHYYHQHHYFPEETSASETSSCTQVGGEAEAEAAAAEEADKEEWQSQELVEDDDDDDDIHASPLIRDIDELFGAQSLLTTTDDDIQSYHDGYAFAYSHDDIHDAVEQRRAGRDLTRVQHELGGGYGCGHGHGYGHGRGRGIGYEVDECGGGVRERTDIVSVGELF